MDIGSHRVVDRGNVLAEFSLMLDNGMEIRGFLHMRSGKGEFVSGPSRKFQDKEGKDKYFEYVKIPDSEAYWAFQKECLALLHDFKGTPGTTPKKANEDEIPF